MKSERRKIEELRKWKCYQHTLTSSSNETERKKSNLGSKWQNKVIKNRLQGREMEGTTSSTERILPSGMLTSRDFFRYELHYSLAFFSTVIITTTATSSLSFLCNLLPLQIPIFSFFLDYFFKALKFIITTYFYYLLNLT